MLKWYQKNDDSLVNAHVAVQDKEAMAAPKPGVIW
jgi:hypothetical protein